MALQSSAEYSCHGEVNTVIQSLVRKWKLQIQPRYPKGSAFDSQRTPREQCVECIEYLYLNDNMILHEAIRQFEADAEKERADRSV